MLFYLNLYKEYSKLTIKAPRNSAKTFLKLTKTSKQHGRYCCSIGSLLSDLDNEKICPKLHIILKQHDRLCFGIFVVKFGQIPDQVQWFYYIPWTDIWQIFVCRIDIQIIFKNVGKNKKVYTKCKSEKNTRGRFSTS